MWGMVRVLVGLPGQGGRMLGGIGGGRVRRIRGGRVRRIGGGRVRRIGRRDSTAVSEILRPTGYNMRGQHAEEEGRELFLARGRGKKNDRGVAQPCPSPCGQPGRCTSSPPSTRARSCCGAPSPC